MYERKLNSFTHLTYMQDAIRHESGTDIARLPLLKRFRKHMLSQYGLSEISGVRQSMTRTSQQVRRGVLECMLSFNMKLLACLEIAGSFFVLSIVSGITFYLDMLKLDERIGLCIHSEMC